MTSLRLTGVAFAHTPDVPILVDVTLHLTPGFTAVVGPNGAGKTTLLRLLAGELSPSVGLREGPPAVHLCPQRVDGLDDPVRSFAWGWAGDGCWALQARLGLHPADLDRWDTLSPGERRRWQIGAALAAEPDVLLLDEPTNHLDAETRGLLLDALGTYAGIGVVVSHDREVLRRLASSVVRVEGGSVTHFPGRWDDARAEWQRDALALARRIEDADRRQRTARRRLADARRTAASAEAGVSARGRIKGPRDHDGRSMGAKARAESASARASRRVAVERRRAEDAAAARGALSVPDPLAAPTFGSGPPSAQGPVPWFRVPPAVAGGGRRVALQCPELRAGDRVLLRDVDVWVDPGEFVWVRGPNGAGKSTLLEALRRACPLPPSSVVHLPQEVDADVAQAELFALPPDERGRVLQAVATLGADPKRLLRSEQLSPGEARKLRIALGLGNGAALLLLDEPTNHLDLPSIERLEGALARFEGSVVLVTHDHDLGAALADRVWTLRAGSLEP